MKYKKLKQIPEVLQSIPSPPRELYAASKNLNSILKLPRLGIVGSRKVTPYGTQVTTQLARQLAEQGIAIVSGLAFGVDSLAHQAALEAGGSTVAVLPSSLDLITPASHTSLAHDIYAHGGALISEYEQAMPALRQNFIARNRLIAGLSQAVLITEAAVDSGSLYTARFAREQGKTVLVVPGNITNPMAAGVNTLLKQGAIAVTSYLDVLQALGLAVRTTPLRDVRGDTAEEQVLLEIMQRGVQDGEALLKQSGFAISEFNQLLTVLELKSMVRPLGDNRWAIY